MTAWLPHVKKPLRKRKVRPKRQLKKGVIFLGEDFWDDEMTESFDCPKLS
jgi:hypothetical protein